MCLFTFMVWYDCDINNKIKLKNKQTFPNNFRFIPKSFAFLWWAGLKEEIANKYLNGLEMGLKNIQMLKSFPLTFESRLNLNQTEP